MGGAGLGQLVTVTRQHSAPCGFLEDARVMSPGVSECGRPVLGGPGRGAGWGWSGVVLEKAVRMGARTRVQSRGPMLVGRGQTCPGAGGSGAESSADGPRGPLEPGGDHTAPGSPPTGRAPEDGTPTRGAVSPSLSPQDMEKEQEKLRAWKGRVARELDRVVAFWLDHSHDQEQGCAPRLSGGLGLGFLSSGAPAPHSGLTAICGAPPQLGPLTSPYRELGFNASVSTGSFFTCLGRDRRVYDDLKYVWLQGRQVWTRRAMGAPGTGTGALGPA